MEGRERLTRALAYSAPLAWSALRAKSATVSDREEQVFRMFNRAPDRLRPVVWVVMQSGSLAAVFVCSGVEDLRHRRPQTTAMVGTGIWLATKGVKRLVRRGRPDQHLDDVVVRGSTQSGSGFPSGHAAVATTLALLTTETIRGRALGLAVAALTGGARVYVGAHLPLDIVGGFAIGALGGLARNGRRSGQIPGL